MESLLKRLADANQFSPKSDAPIRRRIGSPEVPAAVKEVKPEVKEVKEVKAVVREVKESRVLPKPTPGLTNAPRPPLA